MINPKTQFPKITYQFEYEPWEKTILPIAIWVYVIVFLTTAICGILSTI